MTSDKPEYKITRQHLEQRLRDLKTDASASTQGIASKALVGAAGSAVAGIVGVFLLGKRKGRKKNTIIEIRRT